MTARERLLASRLLAGRLLGAPSPHTEVSSSGPTYVLGRPGRPATMSTLLISIFDNSGSVTWPTGTDPLSNRFAEVDHAFSLVARRGTDHELGMVLHFDTPTSGDIGPLPITRTGMRELRRGLRVPPDGAGRSLLRPSLRRATEVASRYPGHQVTLVVLSDFQLFDKDVPAVLAELAAFPGNVHAVVLGTLPDAHIPTGSVAVTRVGSHDAPGAVAKVLFADLTRYRPGSRAFAEHHVADLPEAVGKHRMSSIPQQKITDQSALPDVLPTKGAMPSVRPNDRANIRSD